MWNFVGNGIQNYHIEEQNAMRYANNIARKYENCNIYVTGHSLGRYLTQFGTYRLLIKGVTPISVEYFNGIGLEFNKLRFLTPIASAFHELVMNKLEEYSDSHILISNYIIGDVVSSIGTHSGITNGYNPAYEAIDNYLEGTGETVSLVEILGSLPANLIVIMIDCNADIYYDEYGCENITQYFWITHETDSFYYYID